MPRFEEVSRLVMRTPTGEVVALKLTRGSWSWDPNQGCAADTAQELPNNFWEVIQIGQRVLVTERARAHSSYLLSRYSGFER